MAGSGSQPGLMAAVKGDGSSLWSAVGHHGQLCQSDTLCCCYGDVHDYRIAVLLLSTQDNSTFRQQCAKAGVF